MGLSFEVKADFDPAYADDPYRHAYVMTVFEDHIELGDRVDFTYDPSTEWKRSVFSSQQRRQKPSILPW